MDLTGVWIGETIGVTMKRHHWIIVQRGNSLDIYTRWDDETNFAYYPTALNRDGSSFLMPAVDRQVGEIVNENHFEVLKWIFAMKGEEIVPYYDVAFRRREKGFAALLVAWLVRLIAGNQLLMYWIS